MGDHQGALDAQIHHEVDFTGPIPVFRPEPGAFPDAPSSSGSGPAAGSAAGPAAGVDLT